MTKKFPFVASFVCLIAVVILCRLGVWQIERLEWKNNLQAELDAAFSVETPPILNRNDIQKIKVGQIIRGSFNGQIDISKPAYFNGRIQNGRSVQAVVVPVKFNQSDITIAVEIGCHENVSKVLPEMMSALNQTDILIKGFVRYAAKPSFVTPPNIIEKNEWWRFDNISLSHFWDVKNLSPLLMTAENTQDIFPELSACPIEKKLRNDHFSYALFWFGMAFVLSVMWGIRFLKPYIRGDV